MKATSGPVYDAIRNNFEIQVTPVLRADWNMNKFFQTTCDNTPSEDSSGYDVTLYPIETITMPNRPTAGIAKAIVNQSQVSGDNHITNAEARFYLASEDDIYKYWHNPTVSDASATSGAFNITNVQPFVTYQNATGADTLVPVNKVSYTFENSWTKPVAYTVQIQSTIGGSWTTIATNVAVPSNGKVELWYNGSTWTTTPDYTHTTSKLHGLRLNATSIDKASSYFSLIELAAHPELDLTADVSTVSDEFSMGDVDFQTPLGDLTSNTATIELMNDTDIYTNSNPNSILFGLLDHGVLLDLWYRYNISGTNYDIKQFQMFSDTWDEEIDITTIAAVDQSKFFQDINPKPVLYLNVSVQEAIWKLMDSIGYNNYNVTTMGFDGATMIDVFWTTGDDSVWAVLQDLSKSTQTAIWWDENGVMQIKTRGAAFDDTQTSAWVARQQTSGVELADIVSFKPVTDYEANKVTINWQSTHFSEQVDNVTPMTVVWEPDGDYVLRSTPIISDFNIGDTYVQFSNKEASSWLWVGKFQIDGEWVSYNGKRYVYIDHTGARQTATVKSFQEQKALDEITATDKKYLNHYNGELVIDKRGLYNTEEIDHKIKSLANWTKTIVNNYGSPSSPCSGITQDVKRSLVTVSSDATKGLNDYKYLHRGNTTDDGWRRLGTRMRINKSGHKDKQGGIFFGSDGTGGKPTAGYYVDIIPTLIAHKQRNQRQEVVFYSMKADGSKKLFGGDRLKIKDKSKGNDKTGHHIRDTGAQVTLEEATWFDVDVYYNPGSDDRIQVWVDSKLIIDTTVTGGSGWKHSFISRFGMFVRGNSSYDYEYIYGISRADILYDDQESFYDRIHGGYRGYQWMKDYVYETRQPGHKQKRPQLKKAIKYKQRLFDEFGPYAHEIAELDVKFDTSGLPVQQSWLYFTNDTQAAVEDYRSSPANGHFTVVNISRDNAIVNGDDPFMGTVSNPVTQHMLVYGQVLIQEGALQIVKTDEWAINRRGINDIEYQSSWIQNETEANNLADWLITHWARSDTSGNMEIFGNPLIELGDIIAVQYKEMTPTNYKFYVVGVSNAFDQGLTTTLTLRRVTI